MNWKAARMSRRMRLTIAASVLPALIVLILVVIANAYVGERVPQSRTCDGPAHTAAVDESGKVIGLAGPDGAVIPGDAWLVPKIDNYPVTGPDGRIRMRFTVPQPPFKLTACHGRGKGVRYTIEYLECGEWREGEVPAFDPATEKPTVAVLGRSSEPATGGC